MNDIPQRQNSDLNLSRLRAQRQVYSLAKLILGAQIIINAPMVVILSLAVMWWPSLKTFVVSWGICMTLLDLILITPFQSYLCKFAASIQEAFDCDVLRLEWPVLKVSQKPAFEDVHFWSKWYSKKNPSDESLKNWYPVKVAQLPIERARIICQRANCRWDATLKNRYAYAMIFLTVVLLLISCWIATYSDFTLGKFILVVLGPMMPIFSLGARLFVQYRDAAKSSQRLMKFTNDFWDKSLNGESKAMLEKCSRQLQDEIYDRRARGPLVFNCLYFMFRDSHEEQMNIASDQLISDSLKNTN